MTIKLDRFNADRVYGNDGAEAGKFKVSVGLAVDSIDEAKAILAHFAPGWNLSGKGSERDDDPPAADAVTMSTKPAKAKPAKAKPEPEPEPEPEEDDDEEDDEEDDEDEAEEEKPAPKGQVKISADDVRVLKEAKKLREVLDYLVAKKGIRSKAGVLAACVALQGKVPVLTRIEDLADRVPSALELYDSSIK